MHPFSPSSMPRREGSRLEGHQVDRKNMKLLSALKSWPQLAHDRTRVRCFPPQYAAQGHGLSSYFGKLTVLSMTYSPIAHGVISVVAESGSIVPNRVFVDVL
jgi:hypothetical protein